MSNIDLKPCAHCGHEARLCQWRDTLNPNATWVECPECGIMTGGFHHDDAEQAKALAAAVWNARTPDTALARFHAAEGDKEGHSAEPASGFVHPPAPDGNGSSADFHAAD